MHNYYQILGISATASHKEIVAAYRAKCKLLHPDVNPSADATEQMQMVNEAYHTLADAYLRRQYDERYSYSSSMENNSCSESYESGAETSWQEWWDKEPHGENTGSSWYAKHWNDKTYSETPSWLWYIVAINAARLLIKFLRELFGF